ncbi:MAG: hypothetical protein HKN76_11170 [Saprospiraceae bacterium]|nr:hypothetical protein [Saprospiraceae bacterium]
MEKIRSLLKAAVGQKLKIRFAEEVVLEASVAKVTQLGQSDIEASGPPAMSVIFETDQQDQYYSQSSVEVIFDKEITAIIFLVPLGPNKQGDKMQYEAVFN